MFKKLYNRITRPIALAFDRKVERWVNTTLKCNDHIINAAIKQLGQEIRHSDRWGEMCADIAGRIDVQDIANGIDPSDVANYVEVDVSELADTIDHSMVASYVETDEVASEVMQKIVSKLEALV